jgi:heptosyltransferase III
MNATPSALIYHTGALGDFITTIPALRYWKKKNRPEKTVLLGQPSIGELAQECGLMDDFCDVTSSRFLPLFTGHFSPAAKELLSPFSAAILFAAAESPIIKNVRQAGISTLHMQPPFPGAGSSQHVVDYHLSLFADPSEVPDKDKIPVIMPDKKSISVAAEILSLAISPVAIHPGSGSRKKNWSFERFLSLAGILRKKSIPIMWLTGPAEEGLIVPDGDIIINGRPLPVCAALIARCRAFVGNDSGMAHLAAAVGCPAVVLFGPSDPAVWAPRGKNVRILCKESACSPCHLRTAPSVTGCDNGCLWGITQEEVTASLGEFT